MFRHFTTLCMKGLTHFMPLVSFHTPWKHQKTRGFLTFSGVQKWNIRLKWVKNLSFQAIKGAQNRVLFRTPSNISARVLLRKYLMHKNPYLFSKESSIIGVWYGTKYISAKILLILPKFRTKKLSNSLTTPSLTFFCKWLKNSGNCVSSSYFPILRR